MCLVNSLVSLGSPSLPQIFITPSAVTEGNSLTLTCSSQSQSIPESYQLDVQYNWSRAGEPIDPNDPPLRHTVTGENRGTLWINVTEREDNGVEYQCMAQEETSNLANYNIVTMEIKCKYKCEIVKMV